MSAAWDARFLGLADHVASWSKDPSTQVGCVLVDARRRVIGTGYNGFPRGVADAPDRLATRAVKYLMIQHAEANAVLQSVADPSGATAYVTHHPCAGCAGILIQAGLARIVTRAPDPGLASRFADSFAAARLMLAEAGIGLDLLAPHPETAP
ncbi:deaminase [Defluviimonas sp. D31]|uniref:deoxycytidylate deaminase n=1 Tax=Defluviimonas sp. D31 TaxID=3083253 RepID=UPI00296FF989|nr:deaminase [Defluviimonas sp. D31]MDW4550851.1 deaminase [Defluviimonas sp. D31]